MGKGISLFLFFFFSKNKMKGNGKSMGVQHSLDQVSIQEVEKRDGVKERERLCPQSDAEIGFVRIR